jgi:hypothetical protein
VYEISTIYQSCWRIECRGRACFFSDPHKRVATYVKQLEATLVLQLLHGFSPAMGIFKETELHVEFDGKLYNPSSYQSKIFRSTRWKALVKFILTDWEDGKFGNWR